MTTFTDTTKNPVVIPVDSTTSTPFSNVSVTESSITSLELLTVSLSQQYGNGLGTLTDPAAGNNGRYDPITGIFSENGVATSSPTPATQVLQRLIYTPPAVPKGSASTAYATIAVSGTTDPTRVALDTVTAPLIGGTTASQPIAGGAAIKPFSGVTLYDFNLGYGATPSATIAVTDAGTPTDADGLLTGPGLSKTGVGAYLISAANAYTVANYLNNLTFATAAVPAGATRVTAFDLKVTDAAAAGLSSDDKNTTVLAIGAVAAPTPPLIAGVLAAQSVAPGNTINPFHAATVSDANTAPTDSATLTVTGGGSLAGVGLVSSGTNVYTIAAGTPAALTTTLDGISFVAPALGGAASITSTIGLSVVDGQQSASASTAVTETPAVPIPAPQAVVAGTSPQGGNFTIADETTGTQSFATGSTYSGPVQGLSEEFIFVSPDNLNITSHVPNVFIHTGGGDDAIDVSQTNGNNILDGSTGSNFLTGGKGFDTFYVDDRSPISDVFSTVVGFHAGDNVTIFGINPTAFNINTLDNQGAVGAKGLDYSVTAAGKPNANLVIAGYTVADLSNGRLTATFGTTQDLPGLPGSQYLNIHGN